MIIWCWQKELKIFGVRLQTANVGNNRRSARKVDLFNAEGLSIVNLRFPRALIHERIEFQSWPMFRRFFQSPSTDIDRLNTPRSVCHHTGLAFPFLQYFFPLSFECFFMPTRNTPKIKSLILCFRSLQTLLSLLVLVLNTDWLKRL